MRGKDWPNLWRMFAALMLLIVFPLVGIAVGAVCWGSLERGLMVFNLLGLLGFALVTRPFWRGNRARIRKLFISALAVGISAGLDIISGRPVPFAVYFSSMVECFSLIPWITEILNEIHRGQWRARPVAGPTPPVRYTYAGKKPTPNPWQRPSGEARSSAERSRPHEQGGPELPIPGVPRWALLLWALFLALGVGVLLWQAGGGVPPVPRRFIP